MMKVMILVINHHQLKSKYNYKKNILFKKVEINNLLNYLLTLVIMLDNLIPSIIGTFIAEIITLPICTVKTVYQNNNLSLKETINLIKKNSGYKGFIQASMPAILGQIISTSTKYTFYNYIKDLRQTKSNDLISNSLNGITGGLLGSVFSHPIDVWKNYLQRNENFPWKSLNPRLYYQGYTASIYKNIVLYSCLFPIYDYYKNKFNSIYISSVCTTITVSFIIQPFDYYKTIKMSGYNHTLKLSNFSRGFGLMLARSIPHFFITMIVTENIKSYAIIQKNLQME